MDKETQDKLDTLERLQKSSRDRSKKFLEKAKAKGKKQISALVTTETHNELNRQRDAYIRAGRIASYGGIIDTAFENISVLQDLIQAEDKKMDLMKDPVKTGEKFNFILGLAKALSMIYPMAKVDLPEPVTIDTKKTSKDKQKPAPKKKGTIPDCHGKDLTPQERDNILILVGELYPKGPGNPQRRADALNKAGFSKKGTIGQWNKKSAGDAINSAKKRMNK